MTETKKLTKDRNYYRMMNNDELINHAKQCLHLTELEQVLTERLLKAERERRD
jgi:hypothetical protein